MFIKDFIKEKIKFPAGILFQIQIKQARRRNSPIAFILGTPIHHNLGDQAITCAEISFLNRYFSQYFIIEVPMFTESFFDYYLNLLQNQIMKNDLLFLHGGGNIGDEYTIEENCRRKAIEIFSDFPLIIFPQTMDFSDTLEGNRELNISQKIYSKHSALTILAREQGSYDAMVTAFPRNKVYLCPDMVLFLDETNPSVIRRGVMLCLRNDVESVLDNGNKSEIYKMVKRVFSECRTSDTLSRSNYILPYKRNKVLQSKLDEFRRSELVITDRLHGMVLAAITSTTCIALSNYNNKVRGTYEWIKFLPYVKFANSLEEIPSLIVELKQLKNLQYNGQILKTYFDELNDIILENNKNE